MSAIYMSQLSTALPLMEGDHHQDHHHHHHHHQGHFQAFTLPKDPPILFPFVISNSSASESSLSYGSPVADHHLLRQHHRQAMLEPQHMIGGSSVATTASSVYATQFPTVESIRDDMIEPASYDPYDMGKLHQVVGAGGSSMDACSWTPPSAKMRITRKATTAADPASGAAAAGKKPRRRAHQAGYDADMSMSGQPNLGVIRVCSDCNTTKTPLWRSGPCGPKSLCNACGIRQRKARRAMMAAASGGSAGPAVPTDSGGKASPSSNAAAAAAHPKVKKKRVDVDRSLPFKKRCKQVVQVQQDHAAAVVAAAPAAAATDRAAVVVQQATTAAQVGDGDACPSRDLLVDDIGGLISWSRSPAAPASAAAASCSFRASPALAAPVQQDEITDAAMLLMTLSCGLVRS